MIKALIFDFDGLVIDTEIPEFESWQAIFQQHGAQLPLSEWGKAIGTSDETWDVLTYLESQVGPVNREALRAQHREQTLQRSLGQPLLPGVLEYLTEARSLGLKVALASSSSRRWCQSHLDHRSLTHLFDAIKTRENVPAVKPDPALFNAALQSFEIDPSEAIVFEDSPNGILAAKRAGIFVVAVPNHLTSQLDTSHADLVLTSLASMPLTQLLTLADRHAFAARPNHDSDAQAGAKGLLRDDH